MTANLNFMQELKMLTTFIESTWIGVDTIDVKAAIVDAFNSGLRDGRFWVDEHINYRVGRDINQDPKELCPLYKRRNNVDSLYDALCIFASNISFALSMIEQTQTRYPKWSYCHQMDTLMATLRGRYDLKGISPREMSVALQQHLITSYPGFKAEGARSRSTPEKLSYADALYSKEEQGMSFCRTLFSAVYSHGLACAKEYNDRSLISVLTPIYRNFRDLPFSVSNGELFMQIARQSEFFKVLEAISPFVFESESEYASVIESREAHQAKLDAMSEEEKALHEQEKVAESARLMAEILAELKAEEASKSEELIARDALVESFRDRLSLFAVSAI